MPTSSSPPTIADKSERIPVMQRILDNPFLLLFLGVTIPTNAQATIAAATARHSPR